MDGPPIQYVRTSDGFDIAYTVSGKGTPLLYMPGAFNHVQLAWEYPGLAGWVRGLAARFQLIQFDPRSHFLKRPPARAREALRDMGQAGVAIA